MTTSTRPATRCSSTTPLQDSSGRPDIQVRMNLILAATSAPRAARRCSSRRTVRSWARRTGSTALPPMYPARPSRIPRRRPAPLPSGAPARPRTPPRCVGAAGRRGAALSLSARGRLVIPLDRSGVPTAPAFLGWTIAPHRRRAPARPASAASRDRLTGMLATPDQLAVQGPVVPGGAARGMVSHGSRRHLRGFILGGAGGARMDS